MPTSHCSALNFFFLFFSLEVFNWRNCYGFGKLRQWFFKKNSKGVPLDKSWWTCICSLCFFINEPDQNHSWMDGDPLTGSWCEKSLLPRSKAGESWELHTQEEQQKKLPKANAESWMPRETCTYCIQYYIPSDKSFYKLAIYLKDLDGEKSNDLN